MSLFFRNTAAFVFFLLLFSIVAGAASLPIASVYVDSDQYTSHANQTADLVGHVVFIRDSQQINCDRAHIDILNNEIIAEGHVTLVSPLEFVRADRLTYNFKTQKGMIENGFIQLGQQTIEGEEIIKSGPSEYQAKNATYTACVNCPPSWKISGKKIEATVGHYVFFTQPIVRLYGIPVFWLPWAALPIEGKRESGLLAPTFGFGQSNGFNIGDSYFWAINDSRDLTLTETNYAARGLKTGLEYRFITDANSRGRFYGNYINDGFFSGDPNYVFPDARYVPSQPRYDTNAIPRYGLHYEQHSELPENYVANLNLNVVSDTRYPIDFPFEMQGGGDAALENRMSLAKNSENTHSSIDVDVYENLLKGDPVGDNSDAVHRLPELQYVILPQRIWGGLQASLETNYANFFRAGSSYDEVNGQPGFNPTCGFSTLCTPADRSINDGQIDRYRTGQRLIVKPTLSYPFNVGDFLEVLPTLSYEEDYYQFGYGDPAHGVGPQASRRSIQESISARTRMSTVFTLGGDPNDPKKEPIRLKHEIIPEVTYQSFPYLYQDEHPFFLGALTNNDFNGTYSPHFAESQPVTEFEALQFDYRDRLMNLNLITFGLSNIVIQKTHDGGSTAYKSLIRHRLTQSFDFYTAYGPDQDPYHVNLVKQPWSEIHSLLDVHIGIFDINSDLSYYNYQNLSGEVTSVGVHNKRGDAAGLSYAESYGTQINSTTGIVENQVDPRTRSEVLSARGYITSKVGDLAATASYDLLNSNQDFISYFIYGLLRLPGRCWGVSAGVQYSIGGQPNYIINIPLFFSEDDKVPRPPGV